MEKNKQKTEVNIEKADKIYLLNAAGEDQIKLEQNTKGIFTVKLSHDCRDLKSGIKYLINLYPDVQDLLKTYNDPKLQKIYEMKKKTDKDKDQ